MANGKIETNYGVHSVTTLATFTGGTATTVPLSESADNYLLLILAVYSSYGSILGTITAPPSEMAGITTQVFGESSSQWGRVDLASNYATGVFNRTSSNTSKVCLYGAIKVKS